MSLPIPKYEKGQKVYRADTRTIGAKHDCPDCNGTRKWPITSPAGVAMEMDCPRCNFRSYNRDDLSLDYTKYVNSVQELTIGSVRIDTAATDYQVSYMCEETGIGSGTIYPESTLFATKEEAEEVATARCIEQQAELNETPRAMQQAISGRMGYFDAMRSSMEKDVEKDIRRRLAANLCADKVDGITPGEWVASGDYSDDGIYRYDIHSEDIESGMNLNVCSGYGGLSSGFATYEQGPGNALMLAAAPKLYSALKTLVDQYKSSGDFTMGGNLTNEGFLKGFEAIAKAEGSTE